MTVAKLWKALLYALVGFTLAMAVVWMWLLWHFSPLQIAGRITTIDFPWTTRLIVEEKSWQSFTGDGYSFWLFQLPEKFSRNAKAHCESHGFQRGPGNVRTTFFRFQAYLPTAEASVEACYLLKQDGGSTEYSILYEDKLLVYVSES